MSPRFFVSIVTIVLTMDKDSITNYILKTIDEAEDLLVTMGRLKYLPYKLLWGSNLQGYEKKSVQKALKRSETAGLIKRRLDSHGEVYLAVSDSGKILLANKKDQPQLALVKKQKPWDSRYRLILFDIPEKDRLIRRLLRSQLRLIGAVAWQKSVWVTKENITRELNAFIQENKLDHYLAVVEVREIYNPKLKKLLD